MCHTFQRKYPFVANRLCRFFLLFFCFSRCLRPQPWGAPLPLPPPCSALKQRRCAEVSMTGTSQASGRILGPRQETRCQLQIFTPPLAHCTSLKARGCLQWLHLRPNPHRRHRGAPHADLSLAVFVSAFCLCCGRGWARRGEREKGRVRGGEREKGRVGERWERDKIYACMR